MESVLSPATQTFIGNKQRTIQLSAWVPPSAHSVVVISHGFGEHSGRYGNVVAALGTAGYAVYAADHHGHGRSTGTRALIDTYTDLLDDLDRVIDIAQKDHPGKPIFLLGHSMGGSIALANALRNQSRFRGLILSGPAVTNDGIAAPLVILAPLLAKIGPRVPAAKLDSAGVSRDPEVVRAYINDPLVFHGKIPTGTGGALIAASKRFASSLPSLTIPLLVVHGSADSLVPVEAGRTAHRLAGSSDKTIHVYEGLFHEVFNEPEHPKVLADVLAWLEARR
jgi:acylglycerol lipase